MSAPSAWVLTYAVHSTLFLGMTWMVTRAVRSEVWRECLWKVALIGGVVSASAVAVLAYRPVMGVWAPAATRSQNDPAAMAVGSGLNEVGSSGRAQAARTGPGPAADASRRGATRSRSSTGGADPRNGGRRPPMEAMLLVVWAGIASVLVVRLARGHRRLLHELAPREPIDEGPIADAVARMRRLTGHGRRPRLTGSATCVTPIAMSPAEICLPIDFERRLDAGQREAALAHEFAHILRFDPLWQIVAALAEAIFFFQPLNRVARKEIRECAEHLADDWAAGRTGSPLDLARCLTEVGSWTRGTRVTGPAIAMAEGGTSLELRIRRLCAWTPAATPARGARAAAVVASLVLIAGVAPSTAATTGASPDGALEKGMNSSASAPDPTAPTKERALASAPDTVVRHPDSDRPLAERWSWARGGRLHGPVWIAWGVQTGVARRRSITSSTSGARASSSRVPLARLIEETEGRADLAIIGLATEGSDPAFPLSEMIIRTPADPVDLGGRGLIWLGEAHPAESLELLGALGARAADPEVRAEILVAILSHDRPDAVLQTIVPLLADESDPQVRSEAIQWLGRNPYAGPRGVSLLSAAAFGDRAAEVQAEATDALAALLWSGVEDARAALLEIADEHERMEIRSEAMQALVRYDRSRVGS